MKKKPLWEEKAAELPNPVDMLLPEMPSAENLMHKELSQPKDIRHGTQLGTPEITVIAAIKALFPKSKVMKAYISDFLHSRVSLKRAGRRELIQFSENAFVPMQLRLLKRSLGMGGTDDGVKKWLE